MKSRLLWEPHFFPGNPPDRSATRNYGKIPTTTSFPLSFHKRQNNIIQVVGKKEVPVAEVVGRKQVPVIQVVRRMQVQEPPASCGLFSLTAQHIRQSLESMPIYISALPDIQSVKLTNVSAQMDKALVVTSQDTSTQCPAAKSTSFRSSTGKMIKAGASEVTRWKGEILNIPDLPRDVALSSFTIHHLPLPSRVPMRYTLSSLLIAFTTVVNFSQAPAPGAMLGESRESPTSPQPSLQLYPPHSPPLPLVPLPEGDRQRSPPLRLILPMRHDKPFQDELTGKKTEPEGTFKPIMREESCFGPLLQETSDSSSAPPPQRTIKKARRRLRKAKEEGSESASAPTSSSTVSLRKSLTTNSSSDESSGTQAEQANKGPKQTLSPFQTQCSTDSAGTKTTALSVKFENGTPALAKAKVPEVAPAPAPSGPISKALSLVAGRVILQARRRLTPSTAQRTLTSTGTDSAPTSVKSRSVAPAPANATAGPVSVVPSSRPGHVILQARKTYHPYHRQ
ncbi:hypothetical protein SKAU_G00291610 [Synaphobranchus kaupii]|uniref:Uncharacterized protein n=1 Tax=Synaphobranchus kaupii TaxID=118154 RepID=A0A9Q1IMC2_SYNKA|nr:hypothetical protein SKAU_G00291610 [Synaphobranchus kaupii]